MRQKKILNFWVKVLCLSKQDKHCRKHSRMVWTSPCRKWLGTIYTPLWHAEQFAGFLMLIPVNSHGSNLFLCSCHFFTHLHSFDFFCLAQQFHFLWKHLWEKGHCNFSTMGIDKQYTKDKPNVNRRNLEGFFLWWIP